MEKEIAKESLENPKTRWSLAERTSMYWELSGKLFSDADFDPAFLIDDLEPEHYCYFLDHVASRIQLIEGLCQLSPLADDALLIAEGLTEQEFRRFKKTLAKERRGEFSHLPQKLRKLMVPEKFLPAALLAEKFQVTLGTALVRLQETETESLR